MPDRDEPRLAGMTVNERLLHRGLTADWSDAVRRRDRDGSLLILSHLLGAKHVVCGVGACAAVLGRVKARSALRP